MLILVGPSASGKTEIANLLIEKYQMKRMITYTTRSMRIGEENGVSYNFVSKEQFLKMISEKEFVETVLYNDNYYGTRKKDVSFEKIVILEPLGLYAFAQEMPNEIVSFYLDTKEVERINRMIYRQDSMTDITKRIENDRKVFKDVKNIDYVVSNDNITLDDLADEIYQLYLKKIQINKHNE